jgi:hypothetical protein
MAPLKRKYRTIYLVTAALMVAMIGGYALAATTLTNGPNQASNVTTSPTSGFAQGTITSEQLVVITAGMAGTTMAGTQGGGVGLVGTTTALATCAGAPCAAQNFRPVTPATETVGDYGEQVVLSVTQPTTGSGASGFDFSMTISITIGLVTSNVVFQGYLSTGTTTAVASMTVPVFLFADLGTNTAPIINSISVVFNTCATAASCP